MWGGAQGIVGGSARAEALVGAAAGPLMQGSVSSGRADVVLGGGDDDFPGCHLEEDLADILSAGSEEELQECLATWAGHIEVSGQSDEVADVEE